MNMHNKVFPFAPLCSYTWHSHPYRCRSAWNQTLFSE